MKDFIENRIISAVSGLLTGRVNEILQGWEFLIPVIEFGVIGRNYAISPKVSISSCERTEKERIIRQDVYSVTVCFTLLEHEDGELYCYGWVAL
jgi:hypothetical protein